jgi:uncharacterized protein YndB with AHSA1/START domain
MKNELTADFQIDKEKCQIHIFKNFAAPLQMVWDTWTKPEYLDQWWAPKPYRTETISMKFEPGGRWHYAMIGPQNESHWCLADYHSITDKENYNYTDAFCDAQGNIFPGHPRTNWTVEFADSGEGRATAVHAVLQYKSPEDLEKIVQIGIREGLSAALDNLDNLIFSLLNN